MGVLKKYIVLEVLYKMKFLAEKITDYFISNEVISEDNREENVYGLEVMIGQIVSYTTLIILSIWKKNIIHLILFMIVFFNLRERTGGFHASSRIKCYAGTIILYFGVSEILVPGKSFCW